MHRIAPTGLIERYRDRLPVSDATPVISLGEGSTPLLRADRLGAALGVELYLKLEGMNPTGSFKDRGMTMALSKAAEDGAQKVVCASTGNTSASAAAYAARAGIPCLVVVPSGQTALGKLAQAQAVGATVCVIDGLVRRRAAARPRAVRPPPDHARQQPQRLPARGAEDRGLRDRRRDRRARLAGAAGRQRGQHHGLLARLQRGRHGRRRDRPAAPAGLPGGGFGGDAPGHRHRAARDDRDGHPHRLARCAGSRPRAPRASRRAASSRRRTRRSSTGGSASRSWRASSASRRARPASPGLARGRAAGTVEEGARVVCVLTGHGLKDPDTAVAPSPDVVRVPATFEALERIALS